MDEEAADYGPRREPRSYDGCVETYGLAALAIREIGSDDGHSVALDAGDANPLYHFAEHDYREDGCRACNGRTDDVDAQANQKNVLAPDDVGEAADGHEHDCSGEDVGEEGPLDGWYVEPELVGDEG